MPSQNSFGIGARVSVEFDAKHDVCLQAADDTNEREAFVLSHKPEAIDEWVRTRRQRFQGKPVAIALEPRSVGIWRAPR